MSIQSNTKRIIRNTVMLYGRMLFVMFVSFFTTRLVLQALGVSDYGLVNVIGSVAAMFTFITASVSVGCSRFLSFEIGRKDPVRVNIVFSTSLLMYVGVAVLILLLSETIGFWYVSHKLVFATGRENAALVFFQFVIAQTIISWLAGPYSALIISYEDMSFYAGISIVDALLKLVGAICVCLVKTPDQLIFYGVLSLLASVASFMMYIIFARLKYSVSRFKFHFDKRIFCEMIAFNGWRIIGVFAWTMGNVFLNLLLNSFFGTVVNAARGIAMQLRFGVGALNENFVTAMRPQLIKYWAAGRYEAFYALLRGATKMSYFFIFLFALPLITEMKFVLGLWLKEVPPYTVVFSQLILSASVVNSFMHPLGCALQAVGQVAAFEVSGAISNGLILPVSWLLLNSGHGPEAVFVAFFIFTVITCCIQFIAVMRGIKYPVIDFAVMIVGRMLFISLLSIGFVFIVTTLMPSSILRLIVTCALSTSTTCLMFLIWGMDGDERRMAYELLGRHIRFRER